MNLLEESLESLTFMIDKQRRKFEEFPDPEVKERLDQMTEFRDDLLREKNVPIIEREE